MGCVGVPSSLGFSSSFWVLVPTFLCPYQFQPCSFCEEPSGQEGGSGPHPGGSSTPGPSLTGLQTWPRSQVHAKLGIRPGGSPAAGTRGMTEDTKPARAYPGAPAVWGQLHRAWPRGMSSALAQALWAHLPWVRRKPCGGGGGAAPFSFSLLPTLALW